MRRRRALSQPARVPRRQRVRNEKSSLRGGARAGPVPPIVADGATGDSARYSSRFVCRALEAGDRIDWEVVGGGWVGEAMGWSQFGVMPVVTFVLSNQIFGYNRIELLIGYDL